MRKSSQSNAGVSSISQIIRRLSTEMVMTARGEGVSRAEILSQYLWDLAVHKKTLLPTGEIVEVNTREWLEILFRIIERLEGKPMQAISADIEGGLILNRLPRIGNEEAYIREPDIKHDLII